MYTRCVLLLVCLLALSALASADSFSLRDGAIPVKNMRTIESSDFDSLGDFQKSNLHTPEIETAFTGKADEALSNKWDDLGDELRGNHFGRTSHVFDRDEVLLPKPSWWKGVKESHRNNDHDKEPKKDKKHNHKNGKGDNDEDDKDGTPDNHGTNDNHTVETSPTAPPVFPPPFDTGLGDHSGTTSLDTGALSTPAAVTPEPSTVFLLGTGLLLLGLKSRKLTNPLHRSAALRKNSK